MVPVESLSLKENRGKHREYDEGDDLLNDFQLHEGERASVAGKADAVGRNLAGVFKKGDRPAENDDADQRKRGKPARLLA